MPISGGGLSALTNYNLRLDDPLYYTPGDDERIIGVNSPRLVVNPGTLTATTDFTTYGDKAVVRLTNSTGSSVKWTGASVIGKPIVQHGGHNGYRWDYSDYEDIERNGEKYVELGNDLMFDASQIETIGDYWAKEFRPHSCYSLYYPGCIYNIQRGDVWHLELSYTCPGGTSEAEMIDSDVEITRVQFQRTVGGIGETIIDCRVPSSAWSKTTSRRARLLSAGKAQWLRNRSNTLVVASSTFAGQADYFCDGTADEIQIQAAIDYLYGIGGGEVFLSSGTFKIQNTITLKSNIWFHGMSTGSTIIQYDSGAFTKYIDISTAVDGSLSSLTIDGVKATKNHTNSTQYGIFGNDTNFTCSDITIKDIKTIASGTNVGLYGFYYCRGLLNCSVTGLLGQNNSNNQNIAVAGYFGSAATSSYGFTNCYTNDISAIATGTLTGSCGASGFAFLGQLNNCFSGTLSITNGSSAVSGAYGYIGCEKLTNCRSTNSGASSYGFVTCKSVQQCQSVSNSTHYASSYADSGTSNACADTSAGGYNS